MLTRRHVESRGGRPHQHRPRELPEAPAHTGPLIDEYDVVTDRECLTPYAITAARADGTLLRAISTIGKGGLPGQFGLLAIDAPPAREAARRLPITPNRLQRSEAASSRTHYRIFRTGASDASDRGHHD